MSWNIDDTSGSTSEKKEDTTESTSWAIDDNQPTIESTDWSADWGTESSDQQKPSEESKEKTEKQEKTDKPQDQQTIQNTLQKMISDFGSGALAQNQLMVQLFQMFQAQQQLASSTLAPLNLPTQLQPNKPEEKVLWAGDLKESVLKKRQYQAHNVFMLGDQEAQKIFQPRAEKMYCIWHRTMLTYVQTC